MWVLSEQHSVPDLLHAGTLEAVQVVAFLQQVCDVRQTYVPEQGGRTVHSYLWHLPSNRYKWGQWGHT